MGSDLRGREDSSGSKVFTGMRAMLRLYSMEELNTLLDNMGVCLRAFHETEYSRLSVHIKVYVSASIEDI